MLDKLDDILVPLGVLVGIAVVLLALRAVIARLLKRYADRSESWIPEIALRVLRGPSYFWCFAYAVRAGLYTSNMPAKFSAPLHDFVQVVIIASFTLAAANLVEGLLRHALVLAGSPVSGSGFVSGAVRILCFTIGGLLVLGRLGVQIGPFLTALGVGGLALGLALQDTLGNLFAGLGLLLDRALLVGDSIQLDGGNGGTIEDIGWRTTKIRMPTGNLLVIPNTKLAQSIAIKTTSRTTAPRG